MLKLKNVSKSYNNNIVLKDINISFPNNGLFFILGNSGSGKTSLCNIIDLIDEEYNGEIIFDDREYKKLNYHEKVLLRQKEISIAFQDDQLELNESVKNNILFSDYISNTSRANKNRLNRILDDLDLKGKENFKVKSLSGGELKRVSIGRCIYKNAKLYILDEPLNGLDKCNRERVIELLRKKSFNSLVLVITHQKDEISAEDNVINICDGTIKNFEVNYKKYKSCIGFQNNKVKHISFFNQILNGIKKIFAFKSRLTMNLLALSVSFFSLGMSCFLLLNVRGNIVSSLTNSIYKDSLLIERKNEEILNDERTDIDYKGLNLIKSSFDKEIKGIAKYYSGDFTTMFKDENRINFLYDDKSITSSLRINDLINTIYVDELYDKQSINTESLEYDEVIIGADNTLVSNFSNYIGCDNDIKSINKVIQNNRFRICIYLKNNSWKYENEVIFTVKELISTDVVTIIHNKYDFVQNFVENELKLEISTNKESSDKYPWTVKQETCLILSEESMNYFIKEFLVRNDFENYMLLPNPLEMNSNHFMNVRLGVENSRVKRMSSNKDLEEKYFDKIKNRFYSSELYLSGTSGIINGFNNPMYFSLKKNLLNDIIDNNSTTDDSLTNLRELSMSSINDVISSDVYSNLKQNGATFKPYNSEKIDGRMFSDENEILISSALAKKLGYSSEKNSKLHYAFLSDIEKTSNALRPIFIQGTINIVGVINDNRPCFYHDDLFLQIFSLKHLKTNSGCKITNISYRLDLTNKELNEVKEILQKENKDFFFSLPGLETYKTLNNSIFPIIIALTIFTILIFIISCFLLIFTLSLFIIEDKKNIARNLSFGITLGDIKKGYFAIGFIYETAASISAVFMLFAVQIIFNKSLKELIGGEVKLSVIPYLMIFCICIITTIFTGYIACREIKEKTPIKYINTI